VVDAVAAVAGEGVDVRLGIALLADRSLVAMHGDQVVLSYEALASVALDQLDDVRRRDLFASAARWLAADDADPAELARVYRAAGDLIADSSQPRARETLGKATAPRGYCRRRSKSAEPAASREKHLHKPSHCSARPIAWSAAIPMLFAPWKAPSV
jgi:hypothetical protein